MKITVMTSTGDDDFINAEEKVIWIKNLVVSMPLFLLPKTCLRALSLC
jgi:hypothetical protein